VVNALAFHDSGVDSLLWARWGALVTRYRRDGVCANVPAGEQNPFGAPQTGDAIDLGEVSVPLGAAHHTLADGSFVVGSLDEVLIVPAQGTAPRTITLTGGGDYLTTVVFARSMATDNLLVTSAGALLLDDGGSTLPLDPSPPLLPVMDLPIDGDPWGFRERGIVVTELPGGSPSDVTLWVAGVDRSQPDRLIAEAVAINVNGTTITQSPVGEPVVLPFAPEYLSPDEVHSLVDLAVFAVDGTTKVAVLGTHHLSVFNASDGSGITTLDLALEGLDPNAIDRNAEIVVLGTSSPHLLITAEYGNLLVLDPAKPSLVPESLSLGAMIPPWFVVAVEAEAGSALIGASGGSFYGIDPAEVASPNADGITLAGPPRTQVGISAAGAIGNRTIVIDAANQVWALE
jgi:hypothetical protein